MGYCSGGNHHVKLATFWDWKQANVWLIILAKSSPGDLVLRTPLNQGCARGFANKSLAQYDEL
jgi:hypothetical protein